MYSTQYIRSHIFVPMWNPYLYWEIQRHFKLLCRDSSHRHIYAQYSSHSDRSRSVIIVFTSFEAKTFLCFDWIPEYTNSLTFGCRNIWFYCWMNMSEGWIQSFVQLSVLNAFCVKSPFSRVLMWNKKMRFSTLTQKVQRWCNHGLLFAIYGFCCQLQSAASSVDHCAALGHLGTTCFAERHLN